VDVEAEILDLKLRINGLEARARSRGAVPDGKVSEGRRFDLTKEFAALGMELAGARMQTNAHFRITRSEMLERFEVLRREMIALGLRLDRLLEKDGA
jgi:hypothetical protein